MPIHESGEDYLETILLLHKKTGFVRSIDIANELGYKKPSISRAISILKTNGYVTVAKNGEILLTEKGENKAEKIYERHEVIKNFLLNVLGVGEDISEKDACKIEHVISSETFEKLKQYMLK